jgi:flagellar biosynthesis protein FlhB
VAGEDKHSKTEDPTPKKLKEARDEGQIARSQELPGWIAMLVGLTLLQMTIGNGASMLESAMIDVGNIIEDPDQGKAFEFMKAMVTDGFMLVLPFAAAFAGLAIVGHVAQVRFVIARKALKPKLKKLNPLSGLKRLLGFTSIFNAIKQALKVVALAIVAYFTLYDVIMGMSTNGPYTLTEVIRVTADACIKFIQFALGAAIVISILDYVYQIKKTKKDLKMTKQQVKEENKSQEGSPEIKGKIRRKQQEMSRNRMMSAVKDADVVVVNPVHIAIALQYEASKGAPKVLAKGAGFVAEKIKEKAEEAEIPMVQDVPLARTLHRVCEVGDEIPGDMFDAVAKLLAFVFGLKKKRNGKLSGFHKMPGTPEVEEYEAEESRLAEAGTT